MNMNTSIRISPVVALLALTIVSCGSIRTASDVRDDVYYMPSDAPLTASVADVPPAPEPAPEPAPKSTPPTDDYYNAETATQYAPSNYYDMAYNDPYYYNYGRFGFNSGLTGLAGRTGYGYGQNGMMIGFGYGTGVYSGWSSIPYGYGGYYGNAYYAPWTYDIGYGGFGGYYGNPYGSYYGNPYGGYYGNPYGGYNGGWGPYYGPYGNACPYYSPVIVGGSSSTVVSHRPGMGGNSSGNGGTSSRPANEFRDPIGLTNRAVDERGVRSQPVQGQQTRTPDHSRIRYYEPERQPTTRPTRETSPRTAPARENHGTERATPSRNDGGSRNNNDSGSGSGSGGGSGGRRR